MASTVPGTQSFESDSVGILQFKLVSDDKSFCGNHNFLIQSTSLQESDISLMSYVCCVYDSKWWIGHVLETDSVENDIWINFLHPCGPSKCFYWPSREDICWVPLSHVLCKVNQPRLASAAAATRSASLKYTILQLELNQIKACFKSFVHWSVSLVLNTAEVRVSIWFWLGLKFS